MKAVILFSKPAMYMKAALLFSTPTSVNDTSGNVLLSCRSGLYISNFVSAPKVPVQNFYISRYLGRITGG